MLFDDGAFEGPAGLLIDVVFAFDLGLTINFASLEGAFVASTGIFAALDAAAREDDGVNVVCSPCCRDFTCKADLGA